MYIIYIIYTSYNILSRVTDISNNLFIYSVYFFKKDKQTISDLTENQHNEIYLFTNLR